MPLYALLAIESGAVAAPSGASASSGEFLSGAGAERERAAALPAEPAQTSFFMAEAVKAQSPCTDGARFAAGAGPRCALGGALRKSHSGSAGRPLRDSATPHRAVKT